MYACVVHGAGDLRIEERDPVAPASGQLAIAIALGGICGSDLHYYHDGAVGDFRVREPLVLGHEVVGRVSALGPDVDGPAVGTAVAVHPATPCDSCAECARDRRNRDCPPVTRGRNWTSNGRDSSTIVASASTSC